MVESGYREIDFPFDKIEAPMFEMTLNWNLAEILGYINTWSGVKRCVGDIGIRPVANLREELAAVWGEPNDRLVITWPLTLKVRKK